MNNVVMVGRIYGEFIKNNSETFFTIETTRSFKNNYGDYQNDYAICRMGGKIAQTTLQYCKEGDLVGIKGALRSDENGKMYVGIEKITFLQAKSSEESEEKKWNYILIK